MANMSSEEIRKIIEETQRLNKELANSRDISVSINDIDSARARQTEINSNNERLANELRANGKKLTDEQRKILADIEKSQKGINTELSKEEKIRQRNLNLSREFNNQIKIGWDYLIKSDKVIRQTILNLGMSGAKAELMRTSFENSALQVAHLGGSLEDVQAIMQGYAEETGRARVLSADMVKDIELIGKGTGLGVEQATKLGAQFELMGFDAKTTMEYVQGVVDTSERMGVNTTKVLKNINDNFKKLNTYTFQQGVKGFAQMAEYAEKFKIDIGDALNAASVARTLEGAIDLTAQLQVMGGEFAKTDPFEMLFLSRNDPAKFTEKIADMTKGVVTFRKMSDGTFEKFISPADRDRLAAVAKSLGMEASQLTQIAERQAEIQKMRQQMAGMGLSDEQKKLIEGAAIFDKKSGKFQVELAGTMKDISTLTGDQADAFAKEHKTLEERAVAAQDFETALKATIEEFKSILLPMLKGINSVLTTLRPIFSGFAKVVDAFTKKEWMADLLKVAGGIMAAGFLINGAVTKLTGSGLVDKLFKSRGGGGLTSMTNLSTSKEGISGLAEQRRGIGAGAAAKGAGMKALGTGAGIGAAALGIGAGIALAATGISKLADAMSKLSPEQAKTLSSIVKSLGWFVVGGALAAAAIMVLGTASTAASLGLLALGGAALMIGAGIGIAATGIGFMSQGLAKLVESSKGAGPAMLQVGAGIGAISLAMMGFTAGALGFMVFAATMKTIANNAGAMEKVGNAFGNIKAVMSGSKDDFIAVQNAVESISNMNTKGGGMLAELAALLKSPLKVEFANKEVAMVTNITMEIDGQKLFNKTYNVPAAIGAHVDLKGKGIR
jgi:hypothetical protein